MANEPARLERALKAAGFPVVSVSIGNLNDRATWKVLPASLQAAAQATIDAFNANDPTLIAQELSDASLATSRQKEVLTTCAMLVRARIGITAWNALTTPQKVTQTLAEADVWQMIRVFIDDKV